MIKPGFYTTEFKKNRLKVLQALLQNPKRSDREIAREISISKSTVIRVRRRFEQEKLLNYIALPDFSKLGFELMVFTVVKYNPTTSLKELKENNEVLTILDIVKESSCLVISVHKNYTSYFKTFQNFYIISSHILLTKLKPLKHLDLGKLQIGDNETVNNQ